VTGLPRLRWGVIGAARIARSALVPAMRDAGQDVVSVAARDPAKALAFAAELRMSAHRSYAELIADPSIDAVYIALTNDAHLKWVIAALEAGKHVLCEKPLALNAAEVELMRAAEARSGKLLMEAFCHIFHPRFDAFVAMVRAGRIGELRTIEASFTNPLNDSSDFRWQRGLGGGVALDLMGYCATLVTELQGRQPQWVSARQQLVGDVDVAMMALLDFGGSLASLQSSFSGADQQRLTVVGTEGVVTLEHPIGNGDMVVDLVVGDQRITYTPVNPYQLMVEDFVLATAGASLRFPSSASLAQAQLMDRILASAEQGVAK